MEWNCSSRFFGFGLGSSTEGVASEATEDIGKVLFDKRERMAAAVELCGDCCCCCCLTWPPALGYQSFVVEIRASEIDEAKRE
uniref:Uncharacterized protein n=1 Tax=Rhizophora mucronata TaxID=61149 RepID=A0A2P2MGY2_RHIMU